MLLSFPVSAAAQTSSKVYRVGWLGHGSLPVIAGGSITEFQRGLRDLGYVEGKNVVIELRYANGNVDKLAELANELVRLPVDVIVTSGEPAALAAKRATRTVPIIATDLGLDPIKVGLVGSLARPEGNLTGLATQSEELWGKRLEYLKILAPKVVRLAVLWNPSNPGNANCIEEIKAVSPKFNFQARFLEVRAEGALSAAFDTITGAPVDAIVACWDSVTLAQASAIAAYALRQKIPLLAPLKEYVQAGALFSFGASLATQQRRSAYYVDKVLKGAKPGDLPIERPTTFELIANGKTARAIGMTLPVPFLLALDEPPIE